MANNVFANGRELSCKAGSGKSICAFPDVCMTPPECPATPPGVPVPYPNTGMTSDTTKGSRTVKISRKEVMLKNRSYFKKSMGDEAGSAAKKGVVSSVNRGKVYFTSWSMNVKIEGENAVRHLDMTTHNHGSPPNTPPWLFQDTAAILMLEKEDACTDEKERQKTGCSGTTHEVQCTIAGLGENPVPAGMRGGVNIGVSTTGIVDASGAPATTNRMRKKQIPAGMAPDNENQFAAWQRVQKDPCLAASRCTLSPKNPKTCCPGQTPHHLVDDTFAKSASGTSYSSGGYDAAPCVCVEGTSHCNGSHGMMHSYTKKSMMARSGGKTRGVKATYAELRQDAVQNMRKVFPNSECSEKCLEQQLDAFYHKQGFKDDTELTGNVAGPSPDAISAKTAMNDARAGATGGNGGG